MKNFTLTFILLFVFSFGFSQTTIYNEDFSGQLNKGAFYNNTTGMTEIDVSGVNWTVDVSGTTFNNGDRFQVVNAARYLEARDTDGPAIWYSPELDINGFTNVNFSIDAFNNNNASLTAVDTFMTDYSLDGGLSWNPADINPTLSGSFAATMVTAANISGTTLQLRITIVNNAGTDRFRFDNILVEGIAPVTPTITVNPGNHLVNELNYIEGNVSSQETFTVQGSSLTNNIEIMAPANFVISLSPNGPFSNTLTLAPTVVTVPLTTIYVQLSVGLAANIYSGIINVTSIGATPVDVTVTGEVFAYTVPAPCSELIISQYHEAAAGTPNEQYIELFNPTNVVITLDNYQLARFRDGDANDVVTRSLSGTLAPFETYLIGRNGSALCGTGIADFCFNNGVIVFTGNDVIALQTSTGINIDVVGVIGVNNNFAQNVTLVRNANVQVPNISYDATEWTSIAANNTGMLGSHISDCECTNTTIWDGATWSAGAPDSTTTAVLIANYDTATTDFTACSLIINAGVTLNVADNTFVQIKNNVTNDGTVIISDHGSFVQENNSARYLNVGAGITQVNKFTADIAAWYEYTYWSSPVQGETVGNTFAQTNVDRRFTYNAANFSDATAENNNDNTTAVGQDDIDDNANDWEYALSGDVMQPGVGYACTLSPAYFNTLPPMATSGEFAHSFVGPLNNGVITTAIHRNRTTDLDTNWNFIGNPYASAIDVDAFFTANVYDATVNPSGATEGVIYLWSHNTPPSDTTNGNSALNFTNSDYAVINYTGATAASGGDGNIPNRYIPSGQGFFTAMSDDYTSSISSTNVDGETVESAEAIFRNDMRVTGNNDQFFRSSNNQPLNNVDNKLWINFESDNGAFSQLLIGYVPNATDGDDGMSYDATKNISSGYSALMYSIIDGSNLKYGIQGKEVSSLDVNEEIPLGLYTTINEATTYTISIPQFEGAFFTNNTVYLEDALMNTVHDLTNSDYTFTSSTGEFNNRFKVVFNPNTLSTEAFDVLSENLTIVELEDDNVKFSIKSNEKTIKSVRIMDMLGREIYQFRGSDNTEIYNLSKLSTTVYIANIELSNGSIITKKAIKK
ncbi:lamin tail domain-containing protein [Lacinutrix chionoecetis]